MACNSQILCFWLEYGDFILHILADQLQEKNPFKTVINVDAVHDLH